MNAPVTATTIRAGMEILCRAPQGRYTRLMLLVGHGPQAQIWVMDRLEGSLAGPQPGSAAADAGVSKDRLFALAWTIVLFGFRSSARRARTSLGVRWYQTLLSLRLQGRRE